MADYDSELEATAEAFLAAVRETDVPIGDHIAADAEAHAVVYVLQGPAPNSSLCDPMAEQVWEWQVTSVGKTAAHARYVAGKVRAALDGVTLEVDDRTLWPLRRVNSSPGTERDPQLKNKFYLWDRWRTRSSPFPAGS